MATVALPPHSDVRPVDRHDGFRGPRLRERRPMRQREESTVPFDRLESVVLHNDVLKYVDVG